MHRMGKSHRFIVRAKRMRIKRAKIEEDKGAK